MREGINDHILSKARVELVHNDAGGVCVGVGVGVGEVPSPPDHPPLWEGPIAPEHSLFLSPFAFVLPKNLKMCLGQYVIWANHVYGCIFGHIGLSKILEKMSRRRDEKLKKRIPPINRPAGV